MRFYQPPSLLRNLTSHLLTWQLPATQKSIYLTFDDGPNIAATKEILHLLESRKAKATFFCRGDRVQQHPDLYQKILDSGHRTGNHTFSHLNGWKVSAADYIKDVNHCSNYVKSSLFRPPYGKITPSQILQLRKSYDILMWSLLTYDFREEWDARKMIPFFIKTIKAGSIVVLHDSSKARKNCLGLLPVFLDHFAKQGFSFDAIPSGVGNRA